MKRRHRFVQCSNTAERDWYKYSIASQYQKHLKTTWRTSRRVRYKIRLKTSLPMMAEKTHKMVVVVYPVPSAALWPLRNQRITNNRCWVATKGRCMEVETILTSSCLSWLRSLLQRSHVTSLRVYVCCQTKGNCSTVLKSHNATEHGYDNIVDE